MPQKTPPGGWGPYILDQVKRAQVKYAGRNKRIDDVFQRRFNLIEPRIPKNYKTIAESWKVPLVRRLLRSSQALMAANLPTPKRVPTNPESPKSREAADLIEKWLTAAYGKMGLRAFAQLTDALPADGEAVLKATLRTHRWGDVKRAPGEAAERYNERVETARRQRFPFVWEHVATSTYLPIDQDVDGVSEALEVTFREPRAIGAQYGLAPGQKGKLTKLSEVGQVVRENAWPRACRWIEFFDRDGHFVYMADDEVVREGEHNYGRVPFYNPKFSVTSIHDPAYETEGIADPLLLLQDQICEALTIHGTWAYMAGFPIAHLVPVTEDAIPLDEKDDVIDIEPGGTITAPLGWRWEWVNLPATGRDLSILYDRLLDQANEAGLAKILSPNPDATRVSGPVAATLVAIGKSVFGPALVELAVAFDELAFWMLRMIDQEIKAPVPLWHEGSGKWLEIGPDDINGYYEVKHTLVPVIPMERMQNAIMLADAQARGAITMNRLREDGYNITAPDEEGDAVWLERQEASPQFNNMVMAEFMRQIGQEQGAGSNAQNMAQIGQILMQLGQVLVSLQMGQAGASPEQPPVQPAGEGVPMVAGVGQGMQPGMPENPMAER